MMKFSLSPEKEQFVADQIKSGRYATANEVVEDGLDLLQHLPLWTEDTLREALNSGLNQLNQGQGKPLDVESLKAAVRGRILAAKRL